MFDSINCSAWSFLNLRERLAIRIQDEPTKQVGELNDVWWAVRLTSVCLWQSPQGGTPSAFLHQESVGPHSIPGEGTAEQAVHPYGLVNCKQVVDCECQRLRFYKSTVCDRKMAVVRLIVYYTGFWIWVMKLNVGCNVKGVCTFAQSWV